MLACPQAILINIPTRSVGEEFKTVNGPLYFAVKGGGTLLTIW